jgi:ComF family protein
MSNPLALSRRLMDAAFPQRCVLCRCELSLVDDAADYPVCPACVAALRPIGDPRCGTCGCRLLAGNDVCTRCRRAAFRFDSGRPLFEYAGGVRELIYLYKFESRRLVAGLFAEWAARALEEWRPAVPVVPVPGRPAAARRRGWEHVAEIARVLERRHAVDVLRCLGRTGNTEQKGLDFASRSANLRGRIIHRGEPLAGRAVVLFDDVFTTGATVDECAAVLKARGASRVDVLTIAID